MRHRKNTVKLGRTSAHRNAMLAGQVCELIGSGRIHTTVDKAKATRSLAEKMVTLGKRGTLAARRVAIARLRQVDAVGKLFEAIAPSFTERKGGYTRIVKLGKRTGDNAEVVILEWTNHTVVAKPKKTEKSEKAGSPEKPAE